MARKGALLIVREAAAASESLSLGAGEEAVWDNRFLARRGKAARSRKLALRALGAAGLRQLRALAKSVDPSRQWPAAALWPLPALFARQRLMGVPHWLRPQDGNLAGFEAEFLGLDGTRFAGPSSAKA